MDSPAGAQIKFPTTGNSLRAKYCRPRPVKSTADTLWHAVAALQWLRFGTSGPVPKNSGNRGWPRRQVKICRVKL